MRRIRRLGFCVVLLTSLSLSCAAQRQTPAPITLDDGFRALYNFDFARAHQIFAQLQQIHPEDPLGLAADAAGYLFSEFDRLGILEIQLFIKDSSFESKQRLHPDPAIQNKFALTLKNAEDKANLQLSKDPRNLSALFAITLIFGLKADYEALIEKRNMASLRDSNQARLWGEKVLAIDAGYYDAYLPPAAGKYIVGSVVAPVRWILRLGGISGDKNEGIRELKLTAEHGHYLAPMARIMLATAYLRENDKAQAEKLLSSLHAEFPGNPLFPRALAQLSAR